MITLTLAMILAAAPFHSAARHEESAWRQLGRFISVGGYFFSDASARRAVGTPKFYSDTSFYTRPKRIRGAAVTGGFQMLSATDRFLPFTGGNEVQWIGPSFAVYARGRRTVRPYFTGGIFGGHVRSERLGFDRWDVAPSAAAGAEVRLGRYFVLDGAYRVSKHVSGVSLDGFSLNLRTR